MYMSLCCNVSWNESKYTREIEPSEHEMADVHFTGVFAALVFSGNMFSARLACWKMFTGFYSPLVKKNSIGNSGERCISTNSSPAYKDALLSRYNAIYE